MPITYEILRAAIEIAESQGQDVVIIHLNRREVRIPLALATSWLTDLL